jgi:hypothetical protein
MPLIFSARARNGQLVGLRDGPIKNPPGVAAVAGFYLFCFWLGEELHQI